MEPLVLAVPTFNCARFLPASLESLNSQGSAVRWWLQDGGSTDGTVEQARRVARSGDVIISEPDAGQADALNRAMSKMGGEIIGFINGDDLLLPDAASTVLEYFAAHEDVDLLCGGIEWINADGVVTGAHSGSIHSLEEVLDIYSVWWRDRQWVQPEVFYRRSLWERVGGFDTSYQLAFDYDFWVRCFQAGARVAHLPTVLAQFRKHAAQKSTAADRAADEIRSIVQKHLHTTPAISARARRRIEAQLSYDQYRLGQGASHSFARALLQHPEWLLYASVRDRLRAAVRGRVLPRTPPTRSSPSVPSNNSTHR